MLEVLVGRIGNGRARQKFQDAIELKESLGVVRPLKRQNPSAISHRAGQGGIDRKRLVECVLGRSQIPEFLIRGPEVQVGNAGLGSLGRHGG